MARRRKSSDLADPKAVGCLSAIFRLLHTRFHGRRRLTQVGKTEQSCIHPEKLKEIAGSAHSTFNADQNENIDSRRSLPKFNVSSSVDSCKSITSDGSQSTMLATVHTKKVALEGKEMLRKESSGRSNVVARLMGLEELPVVKQSADQAENASEMRDMIVGALLRCDEEVRALGRVIKMIQSAERYDYRLAVPPSLVTPQTNFGSLGDSKREEKEKYVSINLKVKAAVDCPRKYMHFNQSSFHCQKRMSTKGNYWLQHDKEQHPNVNNVIRRNNLTKGSNQYHLIRDAYSAPFGADGASISPTSSHKVAANLDKVILLKGSAVKESLDLELGIISLALVREIFGLLLEETITELGFLVGLL